MLDFNAMRHEFEALYSLTGRPSVDPELMIRGLLIGCLYGIRSKRRLVDEVHLNLAYRWFCRLGLEGHVLDRSTFSKNRHGRFADGDVLRRVFEMVVERCAAFGLVGGQAAAVEALRGRAKSATELVNLPRTPKPALFQQKTQGIDGKQRNRAHFNGSRSGQRKALGYFFAAMFMSIFVMSAGPISVEGQLRPILRSSLSSKYPIGSAVDISRRTGP